MVVELCWRLLGNGSSDGGGSGRVGGGGNSDGGTSGSDEINGGGGGGSGGGGGGDNGGDLIYYGITGCSIFHSSEYIVRGNSLEVNYSIEQMHLEMRRILWDN